jgi:hypothetical protein
LRSSTTRVRRAGIEHDGMETSAGAARFAKNYAPDSRLQVASRILRFRGWNIVLNGRDEIRFDHLSAGTPLPSGEVGA